MAKQETMRQDGLVALRLAFANLVRAGDESLRRAYDLGQIIDALANSYTFKTMAQVVDRKPGTVAKYVKLFGMYPTIEALLETAHRYDTFDVSILLGSEEKLHAKYGYRCANCGSWDTHRIRRDDTVPAA